MRSRFSVLFCFCLAVTPLWAQGQEAALPCGVAIRVTDVDGRFVPHKVKSFLKDRKTEFKSAFRGLEAKVPCGTYYFQVERSDVSSAHGVLAGKVELDHWQHSIWLQTDPNLLIGKEGAIAMDSLFDVPFDQKGLIERVPERDDLWLSLHGIADSYRVEAKVNRQGEFGLIRSLRGDFVLILFAGEQVLHTQVVDMRGGVKRGEPLRIRLEEKSGLGVLK